MAFKDAVRKADPVLLEPVMSVEVVVPEAYMGDVIGDLNSRRRTHPGYETRAGTCRSSELWCRWQKCSVTRPIFVRPLRGARRSQCIFTNTRKRPRAWAKRFVAKVTGR